MMKEDKETFDLTTLFEKQAIAIESDDFCVEVMRKIEKKEKQRQRLIAVFCGFTALALAASLSVLGIDTDSLIALGFSENLTVSALVLLIAMGLPVLIEE